MGTDIERALRTDYSADPRKRDLQLEAKAHIEVQRWIDGGAAKGRAHESEAIREIHRRFYEHLPETMRCAIQSRRRLAHGMPPSTSALDEPPARVPKPLGARLLGWQRQGAIDLIPDRYDRARMGADEGIALRALARPPSPAATPRGGKATFYPVIFNYQSTARNPAVLTILVTRQGTSTTIVDNARDSSSGSWGQRLFFNAGGRRTPLTAERLSDVQESGRTSNGESAQSLGEDANLLMLVQVPLIHRPPHRRGMLFEGDAAGAVASAPKAYAERSREAPDMEVAVLGHGELEGPYTELDGLTIERDPRFPVRVTVQFYQATSSANIGEATMRSLAQQISRVYDRGDAIGSLVVPGPDDRSRRTNWDGAGPAPANLSWWDFPGLVERWRRGGQSAPQPIGVR